MVNSNTTDWADWTGGMCSAQPDCFVWVHLNYLDDNYVSIIKKVDEIIDNSDGASKGKVRYRIIADRNEISFKYAPFISELE